MFRSLIEFVREFFRKKPPESRTTASGLLGYAEKYLEAAERWVPAWRSVNPGDFDRFVDSYPVCDNEAAQAMELGLKAFLMASGEPIEKLRRRYGHNLQKLHNAARKRGLASVVDLSEDQEAVVRMLSGPYAGKELEYHGEGSPLKQPIKRHLLISTADAIVRSPRLRGRCLKATIRRVGKS